MLRFAFLIFCLADVIITAAQIHLEADPYASAFFSEKIQKNHLENHIQILASKKMEGRETGTKGHELAANYLKNQLAGIHLKSPPRIRNYAQNVRLTWVKWEQVRLMINNVSYKHLQDFLTYPDQNKNIPSTKIKEVVFLGFGIDDPAYSDYKKTNVKGKVIMIYPGEPVNEDSISYVTGSKDHSHWNNNIRLKLETAAKHKVRLVLFIDPNLKHNINQNRNKVLGQNLFLQSPGSSKLPNSMFISLGVAKNIIGKRINAFITHRDRIKFSGISKSLYLSCAGEIRQHLSRNALYSQNVLGILPGSDPKLSREFVVLSAHYDHLGKRGNSIYLGADDNASGTAAVLEIMRCLQLAKEEGWGPKRSILAIFFTGGEKGLLGSEYYALKPAIPFKDTKVNLNLHMLGRVDAYHPTQGQYVYVTGANRLSSELHQINESVNNHLSHLELDYRYNQDDEPSRLYYRSDQIHFAKNGIPAILYTSGENEDYHQPTDTPQKIQFDKLKAITQHIYHTVWEIANRRIAPRVNVSQ